MYFCIKLFVPSQISVDGISDENERLIISSQGYHMIT